MREYDVIIAGGGIGGAAVAYFLGRRGVRDILIVEREPEVGHHSTGRAAGVIFELELDPAIQRAIADGGRFLRQPPPPLDGHRFIDPTGILALLGEADVAEVEAALGWIRANGTSIEIVDRDRYRALVPGMAGHDAPAAAYMPDCGRLDAAGLLGAYLDHAPGELRCGAGVDRVIVEGDRVTGAVVDGETLGCRWLVDAAGAWAGELAALAGATPIDFAPLRRTIAVVDPPAGRDPAARAPMVETGGFYFAPEQGGLMTSPMDEDPSPPADVSPLDSRVAESRARLAEVVPAWRDAPLRSARAGLRTFAPDRRFVIGPDPRLAGFFWVAGLGGWGIESSPCYGRVAADLICEGATSWPDAAAWSPARFAGE